MGKELQRLSYSNLHDLEVASLLQVEIKLLFPRSKQNCHESDMTSITSLKQIHKHFEKSRDERRYASAK